MMKTKEHLQESKLYWEKAHQCYVDKIKALQSEIDGFQRHIGYAVEALDSVESQLAAIDAN